jgi:hypothetical protein
MIKAFKFLAQAIFSLLEKTHTPGSQNLSSRNFFIILHYKYPKKLYIYKKLDTNSCFAKLRAISNLFSFFLYTLYSVLFQLLTSLEFSILEKQCAISLYFVWWPICLNFACCVAPLKTFIIQKIKNSACRRIRHFPRKWHYRIFLYFANF